MTYLKREEAPKKWRTTRKGNAFVVSPKSKEGIPIAVVLREILGIAQNIKEVKRALSSQKVLVNKRKLKDEKRGLNLYDTISLPDADTHYRIVLLRKGKFDIKEVKSSEASKKTVKIEGKKKLKKGQTQLNLSDGQNILADKEYKTNDSIIINMERKKIEGHVPMDKNSKVIIFGGKHTGKEGSIEDKDEINKKVLVQDNESKLNVPMEKVIPIK